MNSVSLNSSTIALNLSIDEIAEEARQLVYQGLVSRKQPIYVLCEYLPAREWLNIENELERYDYLLRDRIIDLIGSEKWADD